MPDVITEVLSSLFTGKAINELFTGRYFLAVNFSLMISSDPMAEVLPCHDQG